MTPPAPPFPRPLTRLESLRLHITRTINEQAPHRTAHVLLTTDEQHATWTQHKDALTADLAAAGWDVSAYPDWDRLDHPAVVLTPTEDRP